MISIYTINLESETTRKNNISIQFNGFDIKHYFVNAIVGKNLDKIHLSNIVKQSKDNIGRELTAGEVGCYYSHIKAIQQFMGSNDDFAIITEDDIVIVDDFERHVCDIINNFNKNIDILLLGYRNGYGSFWKGTSIAAYDCVRFVDCGYGAHAYLISKLGAKKILSLAASPTWPFDYVTGGIAIPTLRVYGLKNKLVELDESTSNASSLENERNDLGSISTLLRQPVSILKYFKFFIKRLLPIRSYDNEK